MKKDSFGDRMKEYETNNLPYKLWGRLPIYARMDGICFHTFCKDLKKPYDARLSELMIALAKELAEEFNANCAYTQSDEISLAWHLDNYEAEMFCGGRVQKLNSHLASRTSVKFNRLLPVYIPEKVSSEPAFDARVLNLPDLNEASNMFLWREMDATRNSIQMAARAYFSHNELKNKKRGELHEMLFTLKNVNWNNYPNFFKRGTFIIRNKVLLEKVENSEIIKFERTRFVCYDMPPFVKVLNRPQVLFNEEKPILE